MPLFSPNLNVSAGTTSNALSAITFSNANNVSFGINASTITASASVATSLTAINVSAGTTSNNLSALVFSNSNNVSFGINGSTVTGSILGKVDRRWHEIIDGERLVTTFNMTSFSKRPLFQPFWMDGNNLSVKTIRLLISQLAGGTSLNFTHGVAFYSSINDTSLALISSTTNSVSLTTTAQWSGVRVLDITGLSNLQLSEGRWIMAYYISGSNNSTVVQNFALFGADPVPNMVGYISAGANVTSATNASSGLVPFFGAYSATTAAFPANVGKSDMSMQGSVVMQDLYAVIMEIS